MRRCSRAIKVVRSGAREILRCGVCRRRSQDGQSVTNDPEDRTKPKADMTHEPRAATFGGHRCHCTAAIARVFCSLCQTLHVCMGSNQTCIFRPWLRIRVTYVRAEKILLYMTLLIPNVILYPSYIPYRYTVLQGLHSFLCAADLHTHVYTVL